MRIAGIYSFLLIAVLSLGSCTRSVNPIADKPENLIQRDSMVNIIVDLRLMDAILVLKQRKGERDVNDLKYYLNNAILLKYNITRPQFDSSFAYYQNDLKVIDEIYADAITKLTLMKAESEPEPEPDPELDEE
jgi:hypothetical protein